MKTHLLDSSEPITEGLTQTAICGTGVKDAAFVFMWDDVHANNIQGIVWHIAGLCRYCRAALGTMKGRYIYGIASGEELKERQREREAAV